MMVGWFSLERFGSDSSGESDRNYLLNGQNSNMHMWLDRFRLDGVAVNSDYCRIEPKRLQVNCKVLEGFKGLNV